MNKSNIMKIAFVGLMTALVFVGNHLRIIIPLVGGVGTAALHFGNILCLLAAFLLGPIYGGLAAGLGGAIYNLTNPIYLPDMPYTLVIKFMLAFVCGKIAYGGGRNADVMKFNIIAAICGAFTNTILYLLKEFFNRMVFLQMALEPALALTGTQAIFSSINAVIAVIVAVPVFVILKIALDKNNISLYKP